MGCVYKQWFWIIVEFFWEAGEHMRHQGLYEGDIYDAIKAIANQYNTEQNWVKPMNVRRLKQERRYLELQ